ncbi:DUF1850 domain-containing protein [Piscinibacter sp.]|jgi:hypothetical protein|uniref:DUF1850 domain-containing protein n=1 Tax=Piscinibacter sp. TaxID=1903157 RepID=UPI002F3E5B10
MDICIAIALSGSVLLRVPSPLTLAWTHSVEHFAIEEDWSASADGLQLREVRSEGLGAGVDIPVDAQHVGPWWRFSPVLPPQRELVLANSRFASGYRACWAGHCERLADRIGAHDHPLVLSACPGEAAR